MKKLFYFALVLPMAMLVIACGDKTKSNPEADSLRNALSAQMAEMGDMDLFLDAVNASMDSVIDLDGTVLRTVGETTMSRKDQIKQNIAAYKDILERQRERLAELEKRLSESDSKNGKLMKTITALKKQIEEKDQAIATLTEELEQRNYDISVLQENVSKLNTQVTSLEEESKVKDETIEAQTNLLNEAYVCIGTTKSLKELGVMKGGFLKKAKLNMSEVNPSAFTKIDIRNTTSFNIPGKKPEILTQAPAGSYTIKANGDGTSTLTVTDPAKFWSMTNYLVVRY